MKNKIFILLAMLIAMPILFADPVINEVEIELFEVVGAGFIGGDEPLDSPIGQGSDPTHPNEIRATIAGSMLSVTADNSNLTRVIVRNSAGNIVLNRQFVGGTMEQLGTTGNHSIEIQNGGMTLVGMFSAF